MPGCDSSLSAIHDPSKADSLRSRGAATLAGVDVIFTGWRDDVRDLLALMDVFVLASWREGMPRSAIEAAAMGKPLVLTDIRGCREVVRPGVEGLLVPPRSPAALSDAIILLLRDRALRQRMGEAARRRAVERFDERRVTATRGRCVPLTSSVPDRPSILGVALRARPSILPEGRQVSAA